MIESIYQILAKIGYSHPLHPPATHLPAGLIIGAFIFAFLAWIFNLIFFSSHVDTPVYHSYFCR